MDNLRMSASISSAMASKATKHLSQQPQDSGHHQPRSTTRQLYASSSTPAVLSVSNGTDADDSKPFYSSQTPGFAAFESQASMRLASKPFKRPVQLPAPSSHSSMRSESAELERILEMRVPALRRPIETAESHTLKRLKSSIFKHRMHRLEDSAPSSRSSTYIPLPELERIFEEMKVPPLLVPFEGGNEDDFQE